MAGFSEDPFEMRPAVKPASHEIGQNLDSLSVHELAERIGLLQREIERLEQVRAVKLASKSAADGFFKF